MALEVPPPGAVPPAAHDGISPAVSLASLLLVLVSVGFAIVGQLTLKSAMTRVGPIGAADLATPGATILGALREPRLWLGLAAFGISALFWLIVLSRVPLSVAYPFAGLSYVGVVAFSRLVLHEHVPLLRWVGVVVVAIGIAIVGLSFRRATGV